MNLGGEQPKLNDSIIFEEEMPSQRDQIIDDMLNDIRSGESRRK